MFQLELLVVVLLCNYLSDIILGGSAAVNTYNKSITELRTTRNLDSRTTRLLLKLQDFNLRFVHIKGEEFLFADTFSRLPTDEGSSEFRQFQINAVFAHMSKEEFAQLFKINQMDDENCQMRKLKLEASNEKYCLLVL